MSAADTLPNPLDPVHLIATAAVTAALAGDGDLLANVINDVDDDEVRTLAQSLTLLAARLIEGQAELIAMDPRVVWRRYAEAMAAEGGS